MPEISEPEPPEELRTPRYCFDCETWHEYRERPVAKRHSRLNWQTTVCPACGSDREAGRPVLDVFLDFS